MTETSKTGLRILRWKDTPEATKKALLARASTDLARVEEDVRFWINEVRLRGDAALVDYARKFDNPHFTAADLRVSGADIEAAYAAVSPALLKAIRDEIAISRRFHENMAESLPRHVEVETIPGLKAGYKRLPIDAAGLYVPAGKAPLPTTAQLLTVAAKAAGVARCVVIFPPTGAHPSIIVAAHEAGADEIYRIGGIAGIAALALGTETIRPVQKIAGPGSTYVQAAKLALIHEVGIDMLSGPSEILVLADETAHAGFIASDILGQCEHGSDSAALVVTTSEKIAQEIAREVEVQRAALSRARYFDEALARHSAIVIVESAEEAIALSNLYKPEHLEIFMKDPRGVLAAIRHAGSVFLGPYAPVAAGDYATGTNHCLPTGSAVAHASPVGPETFMKTIQFQEVPQAALSQLEPIISALADTEGLDAHKKSVLLRLK